jgi:hypothetical protein
MKNLLVAGLVFASTLIESGAAFAQVPYYNGQSAYNNLNARIQSDQQRIAQGVQNGTITNKEYNRLQSRSVQLQSSLNRYAYNGLQSWEIRDIQRRQGDLSRSIYREKRDNDRRYRY